MSWYVRKAQIDAIEAAQWDGTIEGVRALEAVVKHLGREVSFVPLRAPAGSLHRVLVADPFMTGPEILLRRGDYLIVKSQRLDACEADLFEDRWMSVDRFAAECGGE